MHFTYRILSISSLVPDGLETAAFIVLGVVHRNCKCVVMQCGDLSASRQFHTNSLDNEELVLHFSFNKHFVYTYQSTFHFSFYCNGCLLMSIASELSSPSV